MAAYQTAGCHQVPLGQQWDLCNTHLWTLSLWTMATVLLVAASRPSQVNYLISIFLICPKLTLLHCHSDPGEEVNGWVPWLFNKVMKMSWRFTGGGGYMTWGPWRPGPWLAGSRPNGWWWLWRQGQCKPCQVNISEEMGRLYCKLRESWAFAWSS